MSEQQATHLASVFRERHFVVVDGLISSGLSEMASAEIARLITQAASQSRRYTHHPRTMPSRSPCRSAAPIVYST